MRSYRQIVAAKAPTTMLIIKHYQPILYRESPNRTNGTKHNCAHETNGVTISPK